MGTSPEPRARRACFPQLPHDSYLATYLSHGPPRRSRSAAPALFSTISRPGNHFVVALFAPAGRVSAHTRARVFEDARVRSKERQRSPRERRSLNTPICARHSGHAAAHNERNDRDGRHTRGVTRCGVLQRTKQLRTTRTGSTMHGFSSWKQKEEQQHPCRDAQAGPAVLLRRLHARAAL
jgi:hypothetical protein